MSDKNPVPDYQWLEDALVILGGAVLNFCLYPFKLIANLILALWKNNKTD